MAVGLNIGKAPKNKAVLPFYGTASFIFLISTILLCYSSTQFISTENFNAHYFTPQLLSIVHLTAIGWGTMVIFGAAYQLLPVICERDLYSSNLAFISFLFLTLGVGLLSYSFWFFQVGDIMIAGGFSILIAIGLYLINVVKTSAVNRHSSMERIFVFTSAIWLTITALIGILLAINLAYPFIQSNHLEFLKLHAHAGLVGWFLQLITGISIKLIPMFLLGKSVKIRLIKVAFVLQNTGLVLFLLDGFYFGITFRSLLYGSVIITGIICWIIYLFDVFKNRMKKKIDLPMKHSFISFLSIGISILLVPFVYFSSDSRWTLLYGLLLFTGWISALILGMTFKTLPFIVWNNHYKKLNGKYKIPLPKDLFNEKFVRYQLYLYPTSLLLIAIAISIQNVLILQIGFGVLSLVALLYLLNVIQILTHKTTVLNGPKR